jgi:hypothetical protein
MPARLSRSLSSRWRATSAFFGRDLPATRASTAASSACSSGVSASALRSAASGSRLTALATKAPAIETTTWPGSPGTVAVMRTARSRPSSWSSAQLPT